MADISSAEIIELLFKKAVGVPNANPGATSLQEVPGNVGPRIIPSSQIYAETIPPYAPGSTFSTETLVEVDLSDSAVILINGVFTTVQTRGKKERGSVNQNIVRYTDCNTSAIANQRSFWSLGTDSENALTYNIFADAIPSRFDARSDSYAITLKLDLSDGLGPVVIPANDNNYPWYFDTGAGVITFWDKLPTTNTPIVTFWRYVGPKGFSSSSGSGATGPTGASGKEWIDTYLLNPPPKVTFLTPTITSTDIRIGWNYPEQIPANFFVDLYLPYINNLTSFVGFRTTSNTDVSFSIISGLGGAEFVKLKTSITNPITGVILTTINPGPPGTNVTGITTLLPGTIDISGTPMRVVSYYHPELANLAGDASSNNLHVYYRGYRTDAFNDSTCGFGIFIQSGPPSAVRDLVVKNPTVTTLDLSFNAPLNVDVSDNNSSAIILKYYALYDSSGSAVRYPNGVDISGFKSLNAGLTATVDNLYAEAPYTFRVYANNNSNDISGAVSNDASNNTLLPANSVGNMSIGALSIPLSTNLYDNSTALLLPTTSATIGTEIREQLLKGPADLSLNIAARTIPIDLSGTRGKLGLGGAPLARFEIELSGGALANAALARASYGDWDVSAATVVDASGIKLYAGLATEANASVYTQGFYRKATINGVLDLSEAKIVPSRSMYSVRAYQRNKDASGDDISGSKSLRVTTAPVNFYYDTYISTAPGVDDISASLMAGTASRRVSGVNIVQAPVFDLSYNLTNMGHFVYRSPYAAYTAPAGITLTPPTETNLTKIKSGFDVPNGVFTTGAISVRRDDISGQITSGAALFVDLSATPINIYSAGAAKSARINMVVDPATITLVNSFPSSVPALTATNNTSANAVVGLYVDSSANNPGYAELLPDVSYNHDISLNQNASLQISSGKFVTKSSTGAPISYQDYSGTYYNNVDQNTADYSGITNAGTRYATFMWDLSSGANINVISLTLEGAQFTNTPNNITDMTIQYRFIEVSDFNTPASVPSTDKKYNSIWINGAASNIGSTVTASNYFDASNNLCGLINDFSAKPTIKLTMPKATNNKAVRVVIRIGIPMNKDISFTRALLHATVI